MNKVNINNDAGACKSFLLGNQHYLYRVYHNIITKIIEDVKVGHVVNIENNKLIAQKVLNNYWPYIDKTQKADIEEMYNVIKQIESCQALDELEVMQLNFTVCKIYSRGGEEELLVNIPENLWYIRRVNNPSKFFPISEEKAKDFVQKYGKNDNFHTDNYEYITFYTIMMLP